MEAIYIPQLLRAREQTDTIQVQDYLSDLETLTPVQGVIKVQHRGNYLEVTATAEVIVTLTCDRCLQQYNHRLVVDASELIWLQDAVEDDLEEGTEREVALEDLVETLEPEGYFRPDEWLYEQFCLALPQRQLCNSECAGIQVENAANQSAPIDQRWALLESLRGQLPELS